MGGYLSKPVLDKVSEDKTLCGMTYGASSMQGWRNSQEDAHNCCPDFDPENEGSLFAVYDGHGGAEVAEYTALYFPDFLHKSEEYKAGNMANALEDAFLAFDEVLTQESVIEKLKEIAGVNEDEEDMDEDEREEEVKNLCEEASLPIDKLIEKLKSGKPISKAKAMAIFQSPAIKPRKEEDRSNQKEEPDKNVDPKENLAEKMLNGESQEVNSLQENGNKDSKKGDSDTSCANLINADPPSLEKSEVLNAKTPIESGNLNSLESNSKPDSIKAEAVPADSDIAKEYSLSDGKQDIESNEEKCSEDINKSDKENESSVSMSGSSELGNEYGAVGSSAGGSGSSAGGSGSSAGGSGSSVGGSGSSAGGSGSSTGGSGGSEGGSGSSAGGSGSSENNAGGSGSCGAGGSTTGEPGSSSGRKRSGRRSNGPIPESDEDESSMSEGETDDNDSDLDSDDVDFKEALKREMNEKDSEDEEDEEDEDEFEEGELEDEEEEEEYGEILSGGGEPGMDSGCTAVVALKRGNTLYVANAGDSRCVVSKAGKAVEMSFDHKPEDEIEKNRIKAAGGWVSQDGRVNGGLNLTRAFGDHVYKQNEEKDAKDQMISACPDVKSIQLTNDCEFMVLACDGIWNVLNCQQVVTFVRDRINENDPAQKLSTISEELFDICLAPDTTGDGTGCDNMTCIIVRFNKRPGPETNEVEKRAAEEIVESSDEHQTKRRKLDSDSENVNKDIEEEKENETNNVNEEKGNGKAKTDIEANADDDTKTKGTKTDNEDNANSDKKIDTSGDNKEAVVST